MSLSVCWHPSVCLCVRGVPKKPVRRVCEELALGMEGRGEGKRGEVGWKKGGECEDEMKEENKQLCEGERGETVGEEGESWI